MKPPGAILGRLGSQNGCQKEPNFEADFDLEKGLPHSLKAPTIRRQPLAAELALPGRVRRRLRGDLARVLRKGLSAFYDA